MSALYNINGRKILFIHIPKTGGSSVGTVLEPYEVKVKPLTKGGYSQITGHQDYNECILHCDPDLVFTVIRNTWDWRSSFYHFVKHDIIGQSGCRKEHEQLINQTFKEHIKWLSKEPYDNFTSSINQGIESKLFIKSQLDYIKDCKNIKLLRFENLKEDFEEYMKSLGSLIKLDVHKLKSTNSNYKNEYDDETINIVKELYTEETKHFRYEFNK